MMEVCQDVNLDADREVGVWPLNAFMHCGFEAFSSKLAVIQF